MAVVSKRALCYTVRNLSEGAEISMKFDITDNVVVRALSKICDMVCLNIMWLVCCIPIVTIGASTTALYTVMLKMVKNEEGYIFRGFFKSFKMNFKQGTISWLILLALWIVWFVDYRVSGIMAGTTGLVMRVIFLAVGFILLSVTIYVFPLIARYENTIGATLKNALILAVARLPYTFLMVLVIVAAVIVSLWSTMTLAFALPLWLLIGGALIAWINSYILRRVFRVLEENSSTDDNHADGNPA